MCDDGWVEGWHESNGGNLSYRLDEEDIRVVMPYLKVSGEGHDWVGIGRKEPDIANALFLVTAAGSPMRKVSIDPTLNCGIVEIDASGSAWRRVWGLRSARPTSEFLGHLLAHAALIRDADGDSRVVYHAHCQNVIALSLILNASEAEWNRALWGAMTEVVMLTPQGVGVLPWMLRAGRADRAEDCRACGGRVVAAWPYCHGPRFRRDVRPYPHYRKGCEHLPEGSRREWGQGSRPSGDACATAGSVRRHRRKLQRGPAAVAPSPI